MQQKKDIENWIKCWNAWKEPDTRIDELGSAELWNKTWGKRSEDTTKRLDRKKKKNLTEVILRMLDEAGFHPDGVQVLDIGCGPGTLSIPIARAGAHVTSLDISSKALEHIKCIAEREDLPIEPVECSWWTADIDTLGFRKKFDLVIGSMTPSIKDIETFDRMRACSRKYCYYSGSVPGRKNMFHDELYKSVLKTDLPRQTHGESWFLYYFMYLYLNGNRPLVRIHEMRPNVIDWEEAADREIRSLARRATCTEEIIKKIRDYYEQSAVNGTCRSQSRGYLGMMVWDENQR